MITSRWERTASYLILGLFTVITLVPVVMIVSTALSSTTSLHPGVLIPDGMHWENFRAAWTKGHFGTYLRSSSIVTVCVVVASALLSTLAAYAFGTMRFAGSTVLFYVFLLGLTIPEEALVIPLYYDFRGMGLTDTYWALILPQTAQSIAFGTFWMRSYFSGAPRSLLDAARVDGANSWTDPVANPRTRGPAGHHHHAGHHVHVDLERVPARPGDGLLGQPPDGAARSRVLPGPALLRHSAAGCGRRAGRLARGRGLPRLPAPVHRGHAQRGGQRVTARGVGALMAAEVGEQPDVLQRVLDAFTGGLTDVARRIEQAAPRFVLLAARGTSDHAALYAKYLIETRLGLPVGLVSTSTYTLFGASMRLADTLWIAISQSGGSPDLVESSAAARRCGALTLALTNNADSPLARTCELQLDLLAGPERSVAATKTYTASLLTLWLLVAAWGGLDTETARRLPALAADALAADVDPLVSHYRFASRLVATSRGYAYPTAREAALKFMETCYLQAQAFSGADLLHGPIAMVDRDHPVVAVMPSGPAGQALAPVVEKTLRRGADVCVVGPDPGPAGTLHLWCPGGLPDSLEPVIQILPLQKLAHGLSVARGFDPDRPRGLSKVTRTR